MSDRGQTTDKKRTTLSLPHDLVDELDEYDEENHLDSRSKAVEVLARDALEGNDDDDEGEGGGVDDRRPSLVDVLATNGALAVSLALILLAFPAAGLAFQLQSVVLVAAAAFAGLSLVLANTGALLAAVSVVARLSLSRDWLATTSDDSQEGTET